MRITAAGTAERWPQRSLLKHPDRAADSVRRGELAAGLAAVAVASQLALAPVALLIAGMLVITGRVSRWRLAWLLLPALGSACWLAMAGLPAVADAVAAGASRLLAAELAFAVHPQRLMHPADAFPGSGRWLERELPLLALAGTGEAAVVLWLGREPGPGWRPGLIATVRRRVATAALAAGRTVTADGCAIGVDCHLGRLATLSWAQAERGVLLTGSDPAELGQLGLAVTAAALRRRKAVVILDLAGQRSQGADQAPLLAERLGVPVTEISLMARIGGLPVSGAIGRAIRGRSAVLVSACRADPAGFEAVHLETARSETAQRAVSELFGALASLRELGLRGDCLALICGCERADVSRLRDLLALGPATGTAVLLSTTSPELSAELAEAAAVVIASGPVADTQRNSATMIVRGQLSGGASFRIVPIAAAEIR
ncbi:MAG TPA: hypothetical protein VMB74_15820 [Streptosporangiaceae bacterium]|nr:hypothetical protein [Streptosporangiaceae bacterium]